MTECYFGMSIKDFKNIIHSLTFTNDYKNIILCINCENGDVYFKMILEESNITTYYINDSILIDSTDILLMFEYKELDTILNQTESGNIKFILNNKKIEITITNTFVVKKTIINRVDDQLLGTLKIPESSIKLDSTIFNKMISYFIRPSKNLSSYFSINYLYLTLNQEYLKLKNDDIELTYKIKNEIEIKSLKLHIDYVYNFLQDKKYILDVFIAENFPIVCKMTTEMGIIELYSTPILE